MIIKSKRLRIIIWVILLILVVLSLFSCSPAKKLQRLQNNHSYLFDREIDTLHIQDSVSYVIPEIKSSGRIPIGDFPNTPIFFRFDDLKGEIHDNKDGETITINIEKPSDTVYVPVDIKAPYTKTRAAVKPKEKKNNGDKGFFNWMFIVALVVVLFIFLRIRSPPR